MGAEVGARVDPVVLWARAVLLASVAVLLGAVGHVTADGRLPGPAALTVLYAVAVVGALGFLARPATPLRLAVLLVGGQTLVHLVLSATAGHAGDVRGAAPVPAVPVGGTLPTVDGRRVGAFQDAFGAGASHADGPTLPVGHLLQHLGEHGPMMLAHLVVAVLVALWLGVGERALFTLLALAVRVVVARLRPLPAVRRLPAPAAAAPRAPLALLLSCAVSRRGPPLVAH